MVALTTTSTNATALPESESFIAVLSAGVESTQPQWVIAYANEQSSDTDAKQEITDIYDQSSSKLPQELLVWLQEKSADNPTLSISAIVIDQYHAVIFTGGNAECSLTRGDKTGVVGKSQDEEIKTLKGKWEYNDVWQCQASQPPTAAAVSFEINKSDDLEAQEIRKEPEEVDEPQSDSAVSDPNAKKRRYVMIFGVVVLLMLIASVAIGAYTRNQRLMTKSYQALEKTVGEGIAAARAVREVDQVKARQDLRELQAAVENQKQHFANSKSWSDKWANLQQQVDAAYQELSGEAAVSELPTWFTLSIVQPGLKGNQIVVGGDNLIVLDTASNTLVKIGLNSKRADIMAGADVLAGSSVLTATTNRALVATSTGIKEVSLSRKNSATLIEPDPTVGSVAGVGTFNGNVYLLDTGFSEIWRYPGISGGVGAKQRWLGPGITLPTGEYAQMAVDGDVWLLKKTGTLVRYRQGAPVTITLAGFDLPIGKATPAFSVHPELDVIAILDQTNQRAVVINKKGEYQKQIKWSGFSTAQSLVLSPDSTTLYVLKDGTIYATPL